MGSTINTVKASMNDQKHDITKEDEQKKIKKSEKLAQQLRKNLARRKETNQE
jgi:hypothetical protein